MQHRYKINTSNQARKSSTNTTQSQKTDTLQYINLLDKCTQILRQDRIWIRNQLKANDEQIFKIFRQAKRPLNLQHLQIKLRKHVTAIKSKAKMEQLMKFKQNMHLGQWTQPQQKPVIVKKDTAPKYHLPSSTAQLTSSITQTRGLQARMNNSVDKNSKNNGIYPYRNTSANPKKGMDQYNVPMQQITQRQSENMTSARNRVFMEDGGNGNDNFTFSHAYQQWKRPDQQLTSISNTHIVNDPFKPKPSTNTYFNNFIGIEKQPTKTNPIIPNEKPKSPINVTQPRTSIPAQTTLPPKLQTTSMLLQPTTNIMKKSNKMFRQPQQQYEQYSPKKEMKKQFPSSSNFSDRVQENGTSSHSQANTNSYLEQYSPQSYKPQGQNMNNFLDVLTNTNNCQTFQQKRQFRQQKDLTYPYNKSYTNNTYKQANIEQSQSNLLQSKNNSIPFSSNSMSNSNSNINMNLNSTITTTKTTTNLVSGDSLFTSPQLLAQCRNFLKLKSSAKPSIQKDFSNNRINIQHQLKLQPLKFDHPQPFKQQTKKQIYDQYSNSQSSMMHMINQINCGITQSISGLQQYQPQTQLQPIVYPQTQTSQINVIPPQSSIIKQPIYKKQQVESHINQNIQPQTTNNINTGSLQQYFHTFAALSTQKKQQPQPQHQHQPEQDLQQYPQQVQITSAEQFVDLVFQKLSGQPQGFIAWNTLEQLVHTKLPYLADSFRQYLYPVEGEKLVLISNIGRLLQDTLPNSKPVQNDAKNIYRLLDIEQKGYIVEQDINQFLSQLEDSQADDLETISQYLWKLFQTIDEDAEQTEQKKIDYWGIYSKKHSHEFEQLNEILKQFQFQIE